MPKKRVSVVLTIERPVNECVDTLTISGNVVQAERMLRDSAGKKVVDPVTREGRRVDHAVIDREANTAKTYETTGPNVDKTIRRLS